MLCVGQVYHATFTLRNTGAPGSVALAITKPDGTLVTPAPVIPPGTQMGPDWLITYDYTLADVGLHKFAWSSTGPGTAPPPNYENVRDYSSIIGLGEAHDHLNLTSTANDDELAAFSMAATELVESKVGYCVRRTFTDRVDQGGWSIVVPRHPILTVTSVTSVWPGGPSWPAAQLRWDADAGIINPLTTASPFWWPPWDVLYQVGRQVIAERYIHAAKEQLRHLWDTQRGSAPPSVLQGEEIFTATTGFTFSVPRRVLELLEQDMVPSI
jgi:hypothetical protein